MEIRPRYIMGDINVGGDDVVIDVKADLIKKLYGSGNFSMPSHCSILRIPTILSRHSTDRKAYSPNAFSIGPFHHNKEKLQPTQKIKHKYLLDLISRLSNPKYTQNPKDCDTILSTLTESIEKVSKEAKEYYAGPIPMEAKNFAEVLLLDGCFIIELFRKKEYKDLREHNDPIFSMSCLLQCLYHDLILLENQIPWMVLDTLFSLTTTSKDERPLVELALDFFSNVFSTNPPPKDFLLSSPQNKHILDLLRNLLVLTSRKKYEKNTYFTGKPGHMRSATSLDNSGIKFREDNSSQSIMDIRFDKDRGELKIPRPLIHETTETVFRNLISLEQCCPHYEPIVTSYAVLLHNLINTKADIELLCKNEAITTWLNAEEAAKSFNNLHLDTYLKEFFYHELTCDVEKYCQGIIRIEHIEELKRDYLRSPWTIISVIAASTLLILAFLQTLFTIIK